MCIALKLDFTQWDGLLHPITCTVEEAETLGPKPFWGQTLHHLHRSASSRSVPSSHGARRDHSRGGETAEWFQPYRRGHRSR
jgi:hypothetical protein